MMRLDGHHNRRYRPTRATAATATSATTEAGRADRPRPLGSTPAAAHLSRWPA